MGTPTIAYSDNSGSLNDHVLSAAGQTVFVHGTIGFSSSYATGGEALDLTTMLQGAELKGVQFESKSGYFFEYDYTNKKAKVMQQHVSYSAAVDPASIALDAVANTAVAVTGVATTDRIIAIPPVDLEAGLVMQSAWVSAANTVTVRLQNTTGAAIDGASKTWTFLAFRAFSKEVPNATDLSALSGVRFIAWGV